MEDVNLEIASLADYFCCTFVINLPERKDRRKAITEELQRARMPLSKGRVEIFPAVKPKEAMGFPNIGARGCFLSHLGILKTAMERRLSNVLIVEDDLVISTEVNAALDRIVNDLRSIEWGIVYLGHIENLPDQGAPKFVLFTDPVITSHFYAVNGPVIPRLVEYLEQVQRRQPGHPLGGPMHLDGALTMFRQANPDVLTLIAHPNLGKQRPSRSNINCRWYERLPVIQQAADMARVVREYLRA
jgi:glycosyl transferase, family 25